MEFFDKWYTFLSKVVAQGLLPVICLTVAVVYMWQDRLDVIRSRDQAYIDAAKISREFLEMTRSDRSAIIDIVSQNSAALNKTVNAMDRLNESQERLIVAIRDQTAEIFSRNGSTKPLSPRAAR